MKRWVAPLGWPAPPAGWTPPEGWRPDPAWPDPPAYWQFWQRPPRSRAQRLRLAALVGLPVAFGMMLLATDSYDTVIGCGSVDPTDATNYSSVSIVNDSRAEIVLDHPVAEFSPVSRAVR